jgi:hypothetical protein
MPTSAAQHRRAVEFCSGKVCVATVPLRRNFGELLDVRRYLPANRTQNPTFQISEAAPGGSEGVAQTKPTSYIMLQMMIVAVSKPPAFDRRCVRLTSGRKQQFALSEDFRTQLRVCPAEPPVLASCMRRQCHKSPPNPSGVPSL